MQRSSSGRKPARRNNAGKRNRSRAAGSPDTSTAAKNQGPSLPEPWWRKILTLPRVVGLAALGAFATWGIPAGIGYINERFVDPSPVSISVETNPNRIGGFSDLPIDLVLPADSRPSTGPGPGCSGFRDWARKNGGIDAGETRIQVVVKNKKKGDLLISDARAVVDRRTSPVKGIGISCPTAGEAKMRSLIINLDEPDARAHYTGGKQSSFGFSLKEGEVETFLITAQAKSEIYDWHIELTVVANQRSQTSRVDDHGQNFRTAPYGKESEWAWDYKDSWTGPNGVKVRAGGNLARGPR